MLHPLDGVRNIRVQVHAKRWATSRPRLGQFHFDHAQLDQLIQQPRPYLILGTRPPLCEHHALGRSLCLEGVHSMLGALGLAASEVLGDDEEQVRG